ncbi:hypothetical protein [Paenibacillus dokdonensis]|uniref:hypothetical protein n=1 Tax=Paenibacillus dokdonensis TaxID=2567944 RepID=UPI0010A944A4|nr:hypothetical protein [Paenibacillus dokdonensis]
MSDPRKQLLLNLFVCSPILALTWALAATRMENDSLTDMGPFIPAVLVFLVLFPYYICLSLLHYGSGRLFRSTAVFVAVMNAAGLLVAGIAGMFVENGFCPLYSGVFLLSAVTLSGSLRRSGG